MSTPLPEAFLRQLGGLQVWQWLGIPVVLAVLAISALVLQWIALGIVLRLARLTQYRWDDQLVPHGEGPTFLLLFSLSLPPGVGVLKLPVSVFRDFELLARSLFIIAVAWLVLRFLSVGAAMIERSMGRGPHDAGRLRGIQTQVSVLRRIAAIVVVVIAAALLLTQFKVVRTVGVSLLASAGLAGLVLGLAAQKSIGTILAGIQLSITQPIRIGDRIVVENETGEVEQIGLTYVVVKIWDLRRLVVPITYFLDRSFQNWSKGVDQILGTFNLQVDYCADIQSLRDELKRLLTTEGSPDWDGQEQGLQVIDVGDRTQTVRVLVSARTPGANWDLRCLLRERMISYLQRNPSWLPRSRNEAFALETPESKNERVSPQS